MTPQECIKYCLTKSGAYEDYPFGFDITIIKVKGKIFAQFFKLGGVDTATFNCDKMQGEFYREMFPNAITRGWHCPPVQQPYFNSLPLNGDVPDDIILEMIDHSYERVIKKLPKYIQEELKM